MLVIQDTRLLNTHLKVPKDVKMPVNKTSNVYWHADFFTFNRNFYYVLINDKNPKETIAIFNETPLNYSQLAQISANRIASFYAQTKNKSAFDEFQLSSKEIIILPDNNKNNFTDLNEKIKDLKKQLKAQEKNVNVKPQINTIVAPKNVDAHARKFYGGLMTHSIHKNTKK